MVKPPEKPKVSLKNTPKTSSKGSKIFISNSQRIKDSDIQINNSIISTHSFEFDEGISAHFSFKENVCPNKPQVTDKIELLILIRN